MVRGRSRPDNDRRERAAFSATVQPGTSQLTYQKARPISLKAHEVYNEKWLQERLVEGPGLLGLGEVEVNDVERRQPRAGRLDLLLTDPETYTRYEVEIQLGAKVAPGMSLRYNKHYIGLARDRVADNFLTIRARRENLIVEFRISRSDDVTALIEDSGLDSLPYDTRWGRYRVRLTRADLDRHRELLLDLVSRASGAAPPIED